MLLESVEVLAGAYKTADTVGKATGAFDINKILGIRPKGSNDNEYVANVAKQVQQEYDIASKAINSTSDPAIQAEIASAWKTELGLWGDLNNPNRNSAKPAEFINKMQSYIDNANKTGASAGMFSLDDVIGILAGINSTNSSNATTATTTSQQPTETLAITQNYTPLLVGGIVVAIIILLIIKK